MCTESRFQTNARDSTEIKTETGNERLQGWQLERQALV